MLDIRQIVANPEKYQELLKARDPDIDIISLVGLYQQRNELQSVYDSKRHTQREKSRQIPSLPQQSTEFAQERDSLRKLSGELQDLQRRLDTINGELNTTLLSLPNIILLDVPVSQNKDDKIIVRTYLDKKTFGFDVKDHLEIASRLNLLDFQRASKIAGSAFPMYVGKGAQLELALLNFMVDYHIQNGFKLILPPILNNTMSLTASGNLPKFKDQIYSCKDDELHLIPTAEVPLTNLHRDEILALTDLPLRYVAYTPNFRREAGAYRRIERGLMRVHQFNKVELYSITTPEQSTEELERLVEEAEGIPQMLGLHYRVANLVSSDLAHQSAKTYDIEIWLPYMDDYSEVSSGSNCLDYQARRANIRFREGEGKPLKFTHTLNCSGLATPRLMVALLEFYQTRDGHVVVPEALRKYTGFDML